MTFYARARRQKHPSIHDPAVRSLRLAVLKAAGINLLVLQLLFLGLFCYLFGSLFQQTTHVHNLNVVFVDYDGGVIGEAVRAAYEQLQGPGFPTLTEHATAQYPQSDAIIAAVCHIDYWGGLYIAPNASNELAAALASGAPHSPDDVLSLVWNEARYSTVVDSAIYTSMQTLSNAARIAYTTALTPDTLTNSLTNTNANNNTTLTTLSQPWTLTSTNLQPTTQGSRLIYNTLVIILIMIQEFFYLGYINSVYQQFHLYTAVSPHRIAIIRQLLAGTYTLLGSLSTTGAIWAFRYGWHVSGGQFVLTWLALWLFAHLNFLVLDLFTIWIPPPFVPMAFISWIVANVTSILLPFELAPAFYRWGYALPAHAVFQVIVDVWSRGCNPQLGYALPVLFGFEVLGLLGSTVGVYRRANYAVLDKEKGEREWQEKVAAAVAGRLAIEKETGELGERSEGEGSSAGPGPGQVGDAAAAMAMAGPGEEQDEERMDQLARELSHVERSATRRQKPGPCFDLPFTE
ncbi:hypothetical protein ASPACDRAFT_1891364 [Aspergillus aculeatus ATCC 16872]|uniref:DUF3533 domain-containing protein n=1 Tax=Aspergillus aculeatus (strain ATCC 16872 / CBS 172.66 / WB 5094) TaxID=690307 RepID=A0A1L9WIL5_ASPA1|nr:uncharacterized protein ASPACDRAFT_1891364 [Aspergillus aculeatus ATCC 16872]OJJ95945.1 hypothetical protein ASPACDRAFT_1891364 [Aspergillus aculeatus ATCC 16872]